MFINVGGHIINTNNLNCAYKQADKNIYGDIKFDVVLQFVNSTLCISGTEQEVDDTINTINNLLCKE